MPLFSVEDFMGPTFICIWLSYILYGLLLAQVYVYYTTYSDHIALKLLVLTVCILETALVATCMHMNYTYTVVDFVNPAKLLDIIWSVGASIYLELIERLVQSYYIYRIWRLCKMRSILVYLISILCVRLAIGFKANAYACLSATWETLSVMQSYRRYVTASFCLTLLVDSSITLVLVFLLRQHYSAARKRSTKHLVRKVMEYSLSAGILTMMTSVVIVTLFNASNGTLHYAGLVFINAKLYANSMLAMLNIRQRIKQNAAMNGGYTVELSNLPSQDSAQPSMMGKIQVTRDTVSTVDALVGVDNKRDRHTGSGASSDIVLSISNKEKPTACV
ncbi:hypothetical protein BC629DRAFT_1587173 [Irpex lacteus]|nr:hypothetical protein BC629DRAFT_1587173 [Irpex lacteus]